METLPNLTAQNAQPDPIQHVEATPTPGANLAAAAPPASAARRKWANIKFVVWIGGALLTMYLLSAYVIVPAAWRQFTIRHPALDDIPRITQTANGIPGDPLNVALIGSSEEITAIMVKAGWQPADPITLRSCLRIASSSVFKRAYEKAPVSNLYLWNRKHDLAFQFAMKNPRQRHHVRFWKSEDVDDEGRPLWVGGATFDTKVGISHTTGQITHHIAREIDAERDKLFKDLEDTGYLADVVWMENFHEHLHGRNGGGDLYHTDGHLAIGLIRLPGENN
jgi:hypothetical protein